MRSPRPARWSSTLTADIIVGLQAYCRQKYRLYYRELNPLRPTNHSREDRLGMEELNCLAPFSILSPITTRIVCLDKKVYFCQWHALRKIDTCSCIDKYPSIPYQGLIIRLDGQLRTSLRQKNTLKHPPFLLEQLCCISLILDDQNIKILTVLGSERSDIQP